MNHPIPDSALDDRLGIVGTAGSGKTYAAGGAVERVLAKKGRVVIPDPLGVWYGLRLMPDGVTPSKFNVVIFGGPHGDLPINEHAGALIGETVAGMAESAIVDLSEMGTKAAERRFMLAFLTALYRKATNEPVHLIFDEADMWAPQRLMDKEGEAAKLLGMMETVVRRGRIKGFIPWLITQRPAVVNKDVLSQVDGLVALKLTSSQDRDAIGAWVEGQADKKQWNEMYAGLATMQRGQGLVWFPSRSVLDTATFPAKRTFDSSRTPKRGETVTAATLAPLNIEALRERMGKVEQEAKANDPKALKAKVAQLERALADATKKPNGTAPVDAEALRLAIAEAREGGVVEGRNAALQALGRFAGDLASSVERAARACADSQALSQSFAAFVQTQTEAARSRPPQVRHVPSQSASRRAPASTVTVSDGDAEVGHGGLRRILIALAQCPDGLSNRQIGIRAGLSSKSGTFSTYLSRSRTQGWIEGSGTLKITAQGLAALGSFDPLPTGPALLDYWTNELGGGAARLLRAVADAYPKALTNAEAGERAGLSHASGTFSTYLSRLRTLELIEGRGELKASDSLFG